MKKGIDFIGVGVGAVIFNMEGKVFLTQRGPNARNESGKWDFPGGAVEFGEKCENALIREVKEEFNIKIKVIKLLNLADHIIKNENQHWVSPSFITKLISGKAKIMEPDKCIATRWINLCDIEPNTLTKSSESDFYKFKEKYGLNKTF